MAGMGCRVGCITQGIPCHTAACMLTFSGLCTSLLAGPIALLSTSGLRWGVELTGVSLTKQLDACRYVQPSEAG
jgi:hypothetical protein